MQRVPNFPATKCNIKMPDSVPSAETIQCEDEHEQQQRRQQLINFGHSQWGFNNWNWSVTKQEMDFIDFANGKYCVGVVAFVSIAVKSLDIHRENIGYATSVANTKGMAIYKSRKCAVTNALRETLLSFGGTVAAELMEASTDSARAEVNNSAPPAPESPPENAPAIRPVEPPKNQPLPVMRKEVNGVVAPPIARAHPMPANLHRVPPPVVAPQLAPPIAPQIAPPVAPALVPPIARGPRNQNDAANIGLETMTEEDARAERKRRQRLAQEEFRQKQILKQNVDEMDESSGIDGLLLDIPAEDIITEDAGKPISDAVKRPSEEEQSAKRRAFRFDIKPCGAGRID